MIGSHFMLPVNDRPPTSFVPRGVLFLPLLSGVLALSGFAQEIEKPMPPLPTVAASPAAAPAKQALSDKYVLGPEDQITLRVVDAEEISDKPIRIDASGYIRLALAGRIKAAGLTTEQLENAISEQLQPYIKNPQVQVTVTDARSNPVSVLGAVKIPGVHQIQGPKTLAEALSLAGGLMDDAGYTIKITRRLEYGAIPLGNAKTDETGQFSVAEVGVKELLEAN